MKQLYLLAFAFLFSYSAVGQSIYFEDGFDDGDISDWTLIDVDGDGLNWSLSTDIGNFTTYEESAACLTSASWTSATGPVTPNNYAISPAIDLTSASGDVFLGWYAYGQDQAWALEKYRVVIATEPTQEAVDQGEVVFEEILQPFGEYVLRSVNLSAYVGSTVYAALVHYDVTDQFYLNIDQMSVFSIENALDAGVVDITTKGYVEQMGTAVTGTVKALGSDDITSIEMSYVFNGGTPVTETFDNLSLSFNDDFTYEFSTALDLPELSDYDLEVSIVSVNGMTDGDDTNNSVTKAVSVVSFIPDKYIFVEEATGTWCGFCPRGAVIMELLEAQYPNFVGVAVHNADPMVVNAYDDGIGPLIGGYPSMILDREQLDIMPGNLNGMPALEALYERQSEEISPAAVDVMVTRPDEDSRDLTITVSAEFVVPLAGDFRFNAVVTEDGVTGTGPDWAQVNYYAGGNLGDMAGYEDLPDPIPAADMVYDHVGRAILAGWDGAASSLPVTIDRGSIHTYSFEYTVPAGYNMDNMHFIGVLTDASTGYVMNVRSTSEVSIPVNTTDLEAAYSVAVFPNPVNDLTNVSLDLAEASDVVIAVSNSLGQQVAYRDYGQLAGELMLPIDASNFASGIYFVQIQINNEMLTRKITVNK
ncbi:MAG: choice-of-anchor J domain-containing protein [Bacteroidota bacterium]